MAWASGLVVFPFLFANQLFKSLFYFLKSSLTQNQPCLRREGSIGLPLPLEGKKGRLKIEMGHHIFPISYQESRNNSHFQQF
jgi:hypothetical protein